MGIDPMLLRVKSASITEPLPQMRMAEPRPRAAMRALRLLHLRPVPPRRRGDAVRRHVRLCADLKAAKYYIVSL